MVSSRRLAREWALKILYQIDVGKPDPSEALETALEQLRMEFVHRGSRTASGSTAEEISLNRVTNELRPLLTDLRRPMEHAVSQFIVRVFHEVPYWQEVRLDKTFRSRAPGVLLHPAYLLSPLTDAYLTPTGAERGDALAAHVAELSPEEKQFFAAAARRIRTELLTALEPTLRKTALAFAKELAAEIPALSSVDEKRAVLRERREVVNAANQERWNKVAVVVQKQTGDWLRTAAFVRKLVIGAQAHHTDIDTRIAELSSGWRLERQVAVDRNILRIAAFEMLSLPDIPTGASINEAVELAKKFSTTESGRFVNGVLGTLAQSVGDKATAIHEEEPEEILDMPGLEEVEEEQET